MNVDLLSREFPPYVYGGAGVHITELSKVLSKLCNTTVRYYDKKDTSAGKIGRLTKKGYAVPADFLKANDAIQDYAVDLKIASDCKNASIVHSHTWYANLAGHFAKLLYNIPHVITAHSLEPLRPWKVEQLGGGYNLSSFAEKIAYENADGIIAVSSAMKKDIIKAYPNVKQNKIKVILNGVTISDFQKPNFKLLNKFNIKKGEKNIVFVGRITRQKGLPFLLQSFKKVSNDTKIVLCAAAPDTKEIENEVKELVSVLKKEKGNSNVLWLNKMLNPEERLAILSNATVFACPSIYEPLGIVNLEAMACKVPVVATATGGIPEVVKHNKTGLLVPISQKNDGTGTPTNPKKYVDDFAKALNTVLGSPKLQEKFGKAGFLRAKTEFSWQKIGKKTLDFYKSVIKNYS